MHRLFAWFALSCSPVIVGCAASQPKVESSTVVQQSAAVTAHDLQGFWAEYWARQGKAETQRYVFLSDGRFGWLAPLRDVPKQEPLQRSGHYTVEGNLLVLQVTHERFPACGEGCTTAGGERVVEHSAPLRITLEIGDCPPNEEAAQLDPGYHCTSIGGRAFWRRPAPDAQDAEPFFH